MAPAFCTKGEEIDMGAQRRKRLLALILTVILLTEPGWGFFTGIREVWGNGEDVPILENIVSGNGIQEDSASENGISQNSISEDDISDSNISGNEILNGEIWEDALPEEGISQNEVSGNIISGNIYDSNSDNRISVEKISDNYLSENRFQESGLSENRISADNLEKTAVTYKVTFDSQKGSTVKAQMVEQGARAKKPADPVRSKYIFSGWYKGNRKYDFKTPVTANIKLTAKWTKVTVGKSKIKKLTNPSKGVLKLQLKKAAGARGYQIQVSTDKNFKKKNETFLSSGTTVQIRDREKKKTYYVKARAYKLDSKGGNVYGKYSGKKALKIAKGIQKVDPSATAGAINSVALISKKTVRIKAKVPNYVKSVDSYYYLFHLGCSAGKVAKGAVPDAKIRKRSSFTMDTSLDHNTPSSKLQTKFVLAVKTKKIGTYTIICTPQFISNPEKLAAYNYAFPRTSTKKGLQVNPAYIEDAVELGVKHTGYNICLDDLIAAPGQENDILGISFSHNGKTYWFNRGVVESIDHTLDQFKQKGIVVSAILLMRWRADLAYLVPSAAREPGHSYYALNTSEAKARNHWDAVFTFLAQRYAAKSLISNWILGNEVNNYGTYHYTGSNVLANNVKIYTDAYRLAYIALRSVYGKARVSRKKAVQWCRSTKSTKAASSKWLPPTRTPSTALWQ